MANHKQVDTGLGFECDEGVLELVLALNKSGMETVSSCQQIEGGFVVPRAGIVFTHTNPHTLFDFCLRIKQAAVKQDEVHGRKASGWNLRIQMDTYADDPRPWAEITYFEGARNSILLWIKAAGVL